MEYMQTLNKLSAIVWNECVEIDQEYRNSFGKSISLSELQKATKHIVPIHAKGIHHVVHKYLYARSAMWNSRKAKHKESKNVNLPHKHKEYFVTGWDYQSITIKGNSIFLSRPKGAKPIICKSKLIPLNIVEIELIYKGQYCLAIKYKDADLKEKIELINSASIDLGEIHALTTIDNNQNGVIIANRKVRSIIRQKDKRQGQIKSLQSKCIKNSKQYKLYQRAIYKIKYKADRQINDAVHKQSKLFLDFCLKNNIGTVYYGDVDGTTRNTEKKNSDYINHKLNLWCFGLLTKQLDNKLTRNNIKLVKIQEYYTSQTCPQCGSLNKPNGRNYDCDCGYHQHRDLVGTINILNTNSGTKITRYKDLEYLQIA